MSLCLYAGCHFVLKNKKAMNVHCDYIPDAILFICRMSSLRTKGNECALCLYSGCHSVYMPDVTFALTNTVQVHCVYMPDNILSVCRMSLSSNKSLKVHCVYMPESPGNPRRRQESPGEPRRAQESSGEPRSNHENPGEPRRA